MRHRLAAIPLALAALLPAAPAAASSLPPLELRRGQGSVGVGFVQVTADVAIADGLTVGAAAFNGLTLTAVQGRACWTAARGRAGALGVMATAGPMRGGYNMGYATEGDFAALVGPVYESPPWFVRVRAALLPGLLPGARYVYDDDPDLEGPAVLLSRDTTYHLGLWPVFEVVVPIGDHVELTFLGNQVAGLYGRW